MDFRRPEIGGTPLLVSLLGSYVPLARTRAEREARRDPRMSIEERYASRAILLGLAARPTPWSGSGTCWPRTLIR